MAKKIKKILAIIAAISAALTVLSMIVYYFNLDMKLTSLLDEPLDWWYDRMDSKKNKGL